MKLVASGKVGLDDEIAKYLPDHPARGKKIPEVKGKLTFEVVDGKAASVKVEQAGLEFEETRAP